MSESLSTKEVNLLDKSVRKTKPRLSADQHSEEDPHDKDTHMSEHGHHMEYECPTTPTWEDQSFADLLKKTIVRPPIYTWGGGRK